MLENLEITSKSRKFQQNRKSINCQQIRKWWNIQKMLKNLKNIENARQSKKIRKSGKNLEHERDSKWVSGQREIMVGQ